MSGGIPQAGTSSEALVLESVASTFDGPYFRDISLKHTKHVHHAGVQEYTSPPVAAPVRMRSMTQVVKGGYRKIIWLAHI